MTMVEPRKLQIGDFVGFMHTPKPEPESPNARWHVVHINPKSAEEAKQSLRREGIGIYSPVVREMRPVPLRHVTASKRNGLQILKRPVFRPLFVGYHFLRFDIQTMPWHDVFKTAGVHGMLCAGDQPYAMEDSYVENLKAKEVDGAIPGDTLFGSVLPSHDFHVDEQVRLKEGPFAYFTATIERVDEQGRITLLVEFLKRATRTHATVEMIEKL